MIHSRFEIKVGIMTAKEIRITDLPDRNSFLVHDVPIGKGFHWERKEDQEFRGSYQIRKEDNGEKTLINILSIEDYLESVIASEMASTSALELLKAHAVISRSWLLAQIERSRFLKAQDTQQSSVYETEAEYIRWYDREDHSCFDVCADDHCQRYQGISRISTPLVTRAVRETAGEVMMYENRICDTRFSKCCGGKTETFGNTWGTEPHPYLISIDDRAGSENDFCDTQDPAVLTQILNNYDQETSDFYEWTLVYSQQQLSDLIRRKTSWDFGEIKALIPVKRGESGRIVLLKIVGGKMTKIIGKELFIRKALSETHLYSSDFNVEACFDPEVSSDIPLEFRLSGKGWGHGVGLCQIGAAVMAAKKYTYEEILKHYFPLSQLRKLYD